MTDIVNGRKLREAYDEYRRHHKAESDDAFGERRRGGKEHGHHHMGRRISRCIVIGTIIFDALIIAYCVKLCRFVRSLKNFEYLNNIHLNSQQRDLTEEER